MDDVAISIRGLGKRYRLGMKVDKHVTLRDALAAAIKSPWARLRHLQDGVAKDAFWALKDVSLDVRRGEVLGIIGRNGAGKSTLLKILSRITDPTEGEVRMRGRVASLLEVGTGFHPELTGRENIYLNGSILGMKKSEIDRKFDQIVAFSEVEQFLDTPVKHYSSGMFVRLAFAVAAHLEPEILIVDEVLAVGDAEFQKKCLGKMQEVASDQGRTVLFVSHNMVAVRSLCNRCCVLEHGRLMMQGTSDQCVQHYLSRRLAKPMRATETFERPAGASPWIRSATLLCDGAPSTQLPMGRNLAVEIAFAADRPIQHPRFGLVISTADDQSLINTNNRFQPSPHFTTPVSEGTIRCELGMVPLVGRRFFVSLFLGDQAFDTHVIEDALSFEVVEHDIWGLGKVPPAQASLLWWPATFDFRAADGNISATDRRKAS